MKLSKALKGASEPLIIVASAGDRAKDTTVASYKDQKGNRFTINAFESENPFSPINGGDAERVDEEVRVLTAAEVADMPIIGECGCGTVIKTLDEVASVISHTGKCPVCADDVVFVATADDDEDEDRDVTEQTASEGDEDEDADGDTVTTAGEDDAPHGVGGPGSDAPAQGGEMPPEVKDPAPGTQGDQPQPNQQPDAPAQGGEQFPKGADGDTREQTAADAEGDANQEEQPHGVGGPGSDAPAQGGETPQSPNPAAFDPNAPVRNSDGMDAPAQGGERPPAVEGASVTAALVELSELNGAELAFVRNGNRIWVMCNDQPAIVLDKAAATDTIQNIWDKTSLTDSFVTETQNGMTPETLASFGGQVIEVGLPLSKVQADAIDQAVQEVLTEQKDKIADLEGDFEQSVKIAMAGISKGIWGENARNPVALALVEALRRAQVHHPEHLVQQAFTDAGEDLIKLTLDKTKEVMAMSQETRNVTAGLLQTAPAHTVTASAGDQTVERLSSGLTIVPDDRDESTASAESDPAERAQNRALFRGMGRRV